MFFVVLKREKYQKRVFFVFVAMEMEVVSWFRAMV